MEIKEYTDFNEKELFDLYNSVGWSAYCDDFKSLMLGFANSLLVLGAYQENKLVGLIRIVGDGNTIIYIQDLLVNPKYQHQGVGKTLLNKVLQRYKNVRQIILLCDNDSYLQSIYKLNGFKEASEVGCISFIKINK